MPNNIVSGYGMTPHRYGESIADAFLPNPDTEQNLLENLYGSGYIGQNVTNVQEERSPFGKLLQGIGVLGQPDARALTPYEQYMYQRGQHERGQADYQTEEQRINNIKAALGLGENVVKEQGQMPPGTIMDLLPPDMRGGFGPELTKQQQADQQKTDYDELRVRRLKQLIGQGQYAEDVTRQQVDEQRHATLRNKWALMPPVVELRKRYAKLMDAADAIDDPRDPRKLMILSKARDLQQEMLQYYTMHGVGSGELTPSDAASLAGVGPDSLPPKKDVPSNYPWDANAIDKALSGPGMIGIPQY